MPGDIIRFPGRSPSTPKDAQTTADSSLRPAANNSVSAILHERIAARTASLPAEIAVRELIDPLIGESSVAAIHQISLFDELLDTILPALVEQGELRIEASSLYQPELLGSGYGGLNAGHYALLLFDIRLAQDATVAFVLPEALRERVSSYGGQLDTSQQVTSTLSIALHLPLVDETKAATSSAEASAKGSPDPAHVLLVDDNEDVQAIVCTMLEKLGYQVTARSGGVEALDTVRRSPEEFQLVLCDVTMPRLGGLELVTRLRAIRQDLPVLLMTGFSVETTETKGFDKTAVLRKPFTLAQLKRSVTQALDG